MVREIAQDGPVGFVGLGEMGFGMAANVLADGYTTLATDVRDEPVEALADRGGTAVDSPAALGRSCRSIHVVVVTDDQVTDVVAGAAGLFSGAQDTDQETVIVVHSSVLPETCEALADDAPDNVAILDAPVSGGQSRADAGELTMMVGGESNAIEFCRPVLEVMARDIFEIGDLGMGQAAKLAHNVTAISNLMTTIEGLALGEAYGIDRRDLLDLFESGAADSAMLGHHREFLTDDPNEIDLDSADRHASIIEKDLYHALDLAMGIDVDLGGAALASQKVPAFYRGLAGRD